MKPFKHHFPRNLSTKISHRFNHNSPLLHPTREISLKVSNSPNLNHLRQLYAQILRTHFQTSHPEPFHYNNISRTFLKLNSSTESLHVFISMSRAGVSPDTFTLPIILKATTHSFNHSFVKQLHCLSVKHGLDKDTYTESGLISVYSKLGEFGSARKVFDESRERKLGSWNAVIAGLSQGGRAKEAVEVFLEMMGCGFCVPDDVTMVSLTSACGSLGDLGLAFQLHKCVFQAVGFDKPVVVMMNSVIDMYGKCGRMDLACKVFSRMSVKNVSSWTSMIVGYAAHGYVREALDCFRRMREEGAEVGVRPNHVTFVGVLTACVHGGMVREGKRFFDMMTSVYGIRPMLQHYGCMVDLLGRAGLFDEAKMMVESMPMKANVVIWGCLMGACEKYGNVEMGEWVGKHLVELEPWNDGVYVVLSNIYANHGLWKEVERLRGIMKEKKVAKIPAYSLPESSLD